MPAAGVERGDAAIVVVNGLGGTGPRELQLLFGEAARWLTEAGIMVVRSLVGSFVTALDMSGASLTVVKVDDEMLALGDAPTAAPAVTGPMVTTVAEVAMVAPDDAAAQGPENDWLSTFIGRVIGAVDELTDLDRRAGDGDLGTNMQVALGHYQIPVRGSDSDVLRAISTSYFVRAGGTSGVMFGTFFDALGRALSPQWSEREFAAGVRAALALAD